MTSRSDGTEEPDRLVEFGAALRAARTERKISQVELAGMLTTTQSAVSAWENGDDEPGRDRVFEIERCLDLPAGSLSRHLGYLPIEYDGRRKRLTFDDFLMVEEDRLTPEQRKTLRDLYRQLTGPERPPRRRAPRR